MNKINEFIKTLSENDKKTLTGKTLKATEELGELAKAILPYENAPGTLHRFVQRRQILENAVDVMLCTMSIAYDLKFSDEEIESMMHEKATKWAGLQAKEGRVKFPLPYEIHVTIDSMVHSVPGLLHEFKTICQNNNLKSIIIELEKNGETLMSDVMTSSVHYGDNNSAINAANEIANHFKINGYDVLRVKIETVPWHPAAPSVNDVNFSMPENGYFESHLRIVTTKQMKPILEKIAKQFNAHLSRNFFKKLNDNEYIIMMTLRDYKSASEVFIGKVNKLKEVLTNAAFAVDKTEIEFAVYDSNVDHDLEWIRG
jgi:hypothetical protein